MSRIDWHLSSKYLCSGLILQSIESIESPTQPMSYSPPPVVNVELHGCSISSFCVKTIAYVHLNPSTTTPCSAAVRKSGSKMQHVTIGACALSARTYSAEVQGSDARLRNHFVKKNTQNVHLPNVCTKRLSVLYEFFTNQPLLIAIFINNVIIPCYQSDIA